MIIFSQFYEEKSNPTTTTISDITVPNTKKKTK